MNLYEHTIIARQDVSATQLKSLTEKYSKIIENFDGDIVKTENWGLMNLSYMIKKNKKGNYIHFKIKGDNKIINELSILNAFSSEDLVEQRLIKYNSIGVINK